MNDMNNPQPIHKISLDEVFKKAFFYWKSTLVFQAFVTILYFGITLFAGVQLSMYYFGDKMNQFTPELLSNAKEFLNKINLMMQSENGSYFQIALALIKAAMFPISIGLFKIYSLIDENKKPTLSDVMDGYSGSNFFKFWGFAIFWNVVFQMGSSFFIIPGILWVLITFFVGPLLYFTPMRMMEAINLSAKVVFANWSIILPCAVVAFLFSYSGLMLFFIGFLFTYPFWNAIIYTLFKKYFNIKFV
jgi:hypothetical protein